MHLQPSIYMILIGNSCTGGNLKTFCVLDVQDTSHIGLCLLSCSRPLTPSLQLTMKHSLQNMLVCKCTGCGEIWNNYFITYFVLISSQHRCSYPGCTNVHVIHWNMKNRRDICCHWSRFHWVHGLAGDNQDRLPTYCSKFCYYHSPRVANMSLQDETQQLYSSNENVVGLNTSKKQTQSGTYY